MIETARGLIAANGLRSLKVRDVAEAADCSIGSVYNEFGDFDALILTVNRETVQALTARLVAVPAEHPVRQLHGLAETYLTFAADHANLLRALAGRRLPAGQDPADVAGPGNALDRRSGDMDDNLAKSLYEFDGIVDESGGQVGNEGGHGGSRQV